jgi:hypothetical protein
MTPPTKTVPTPEPLASAGSPSAPTSQSARDARWSSAGGASSGPPDPPLAHASPFGDTAGGWAELRLLAEMYEDAQKARIACANRVGSSTIDPDLTAGLIAALEATEKEMGKALKAQYRRSVPDPIRQWQADTRGIGEHMLARLLGVIGHPVIAQPYHWEGEGADRTLVADPPFRRNVAKLWAYCGHGDPGRKRAKGMTAEAAAALGNPRAKMITHLLAESVIKLANVDYRAVYDDRRNHTADTHPEWTKGHSHNDALHVVGKQILRDLWVASHEGATK